MRIVTLYVTLIAGEIFSEIEAFNLPGWYVPAVEYLTVFLGVA